MHRTPTTHTDRQTRHVPSTHDASPGIWHIGADILIAPSSTSAGEMRAVRINSTDPGPEPWEPLTAGRRYERPAGGGWDEGEDDDEGGEVEKEEGEVESSPVRKRIEEGIEERYRDDRYEHYEQRAVIDMADGEGVVRTQLASVRRVAVSEGRDGGASGGGADTARTPPSLSQGSPYPDSYVPGRRNERESLGTRGNTRRRERRTGRYEDRLGEGYGGGD